MGLLFPAVKCRSEAAESGTVPPSVERVIEEYCVTMSDAASERRAARQALALNELRTRVEERIARLETAKNELEVTIKRHEELRKLADQDLVNIYAGMAPDVAASQMANIAPSLASSVLRQLKPHQASAILNEMKPDAAAQLVQIIASGLNTVAGNK